MVQNICTFSDFHSPQTCLDLFMWAWVYVKQIFTVLFVNRKKNSEIEIGIDHFIDTNAINDWAHCIDCWSISCLKEHRFSDSTHFYLSLLSIFISGPENSVKTSKKRHACDCAQAPLFNPLTAVVTKCMSSSKMDQLKKIFEDHSKRN